MSDFTVMLFSTAFTPETCLVALTALVAISCESTNPDSCTTPRKVSMWIWVEATPRSLMSAVRTLFVISRSSNDSPVLCWVLVPAQAASARSAARMRWGRVRMAFLQTIGWGSIPCSSRAQPWRSTGAPMHCNSCKARKLYRQPSLDPTRCNGLGETLNEIRDEQAHLRREVPAGRVHRVDRRGVRRVVRQQLHEPPRAHVVADHEVGLEGDPRAERRERDIQIPAVGVRISPDAHCVLAAIVVEEAPLVAR